MAAVEPSQLDRASFQSLACSYAALLLHDVGKELSAANLDAVLKAASAKVDKTYAGQMSSALKHANLGNMLSGAGSAPVAGPAASTAASAAPTSAPAAGKKAEKKEEKKEEEEEDAGGAMDLFGGGDEEW